MKRLRLMAAALVAALAIACGGDADGSGGSAGKAGAGGSSGAAGASGIGGIAGDAGSAGAEPGIYAVETWSALEPAVIQAFDGMVGDARVVALGESVHTSGGYAEVKAVLARHLIEDRGFRVLALETPRTNAELVDAFVASDCQGSVAEAMKGMFWVFADEHLAGLLEWVCQFNQAHPAERVTFVGFDVQQPWQDGPMLTAFLQGLSVVGAEDLWPKIATCDGVDAVSAKDYYGSGGFDVPITSADLAACTDATQSIGAFFDAHATAIEAETSARELRLARLALLGISAWEDAKYYLSLDPTKSYQARDSAMAEVLLELIALDHADQKTVLLAHNFHIRHNSLASTSYPPNVACTGSVVRQALGDDYIAFGFLSSLTLTNWPSVSCGPLPNPGPNDLESVLADAGAPSLLVDLGHPELSLIAPGQSYGFGLNAGGDNAVPAEQYRGLVWRAESAAMKSVFGPTTCDN